MVEESLYTGKSKAVSKTYKKTPPFCNQAKWLTDFRQSIKFKQHHMATCLEMYLPNYNRVELGRAIMSKDVLKRLLPLIDTAVKYGHVAGKKELLTSLSEALTLDHKNGINRILKKHL